MDTAITVAIIALIGSVVTGVINIVAAKSKQKQEHAFQVEDSRSDWQKSVDQKLATDKARIDTLTVEVSNQKEMDRMLLKGTMLMCGHLVDGNHTSDLKKYENDINEYLQKRI